MPANAGIQASGRRAGPREKAVVGAPLLADIRDGVEAQRLAEAAIVSLRTGAPVRVDRESRPV
jgi:hypothetical protein